MITFNAQISAQQLLGLTLALGAIFGCGLWLLLLRRTRSPYRIKFPASSPRMLRSRRVKLTERMLMNSSVILPGDTVVAAHSGSGVFSGAFSPLRLLQGGTYRFLEKIGGKKLENLLRSAGLEDSPSRFRSRQVGWVVLSLGAGIGIASLAVSSGLTGVLTLLLLPPAAVLLTIMGSEQWLKRTARRRRERLLAELPSALEFLSLCLAAGEGVVEGLRRIAQTSSGELGKEFQRVLDHLDEGSTLEQALRHLASKLDIPPVERAITHIVIAVERGTPLASVLIVQAQEARQASKLALIEKAGKKEIGMMLPLVFLILPITILFAVFPGLQAVSFGI